MRRLRWTAAQDNRLRGLIADGLSWDEIARTLGRTPSAVEHRARCLGARPPTLVRQAADAARRARLRGWPVMEGAPEERERRFLAALWAEARACGLVAPRPGGRPGAPLQAQPETPPLETHPLETTGDPA